MFEILSSTLNQESDPSPTIRQKSRPPKPEVILQNATAPNANPSIPKIGRFETSGFFWVNKIGKLKICHPENYTTLGGVWTTPFL